MDVARFLVGGVLPYVAVVVFLVAMAYRIYTWKRLAAPSMTLFPAPEDESACAAAEFVAPETTLQRQLQGIWGVFLYQTHIGIDDNFFELGGHSLLATRVVNQINREFGINLALRTLFEQPTIRRRAVEIGALARTSRSDAGADGPGDMIRAIPRVPRKA